MSIRSLVLKESVNFCSRIFFRKKVPQKYQCIAFILPVVYCSTQPPKKIDIPDPGSLTHSFLLKQASCITVNSASQLLSQTVVAILDTAAQYKKALDDVMTLIEECQTNIGNEVLQQELADSIISFRAKVNEYKAQYLELQSLFEYVEKVVVSTTETSFLVGAEYASTSLSDHLYTAKQEISKVKRMIETLEYEYIEVQKSFIKKTSDYEDRKNKDDNDQ